MFGRLILMRIVFFFFFCRNLGKNIDRNRFSKNKIKQNARQCIIDRHFTKKRKKILLFGKFRAFEMENSMEKINKF